MTRTTEQIGPTPEERRRNKIRSIIFGYGEDALIRLHNDRTVVNTHILTRFYMRDMVDHCLGETMSEHTKRVRLNEIAEVVADELGISLTDAKMKVNLFGAAIDKAAALAMGGETPEQTIDCGSLVTRRPLRQMVSTHTMLTRSQADLMMITLVPPNVLPDALLSEFDPAPPSHYRAIYGHLLPEDKVEKLELDEVKGETAAQIHTQQMAILRKYYPHEDDELIEARHVLYKVQYAAEALVQAINVEKESKETAAAALPEGVKLGNIHFLSQKQVKPAREQLARVLTEISNWDKVRAESAVHKFEAGIRSLMANEHNHAPAAQSR